MTGLRFLKKIAASLYGGITSARNRFYEIGLLKVHDSGLPVISIGNVTAGGNAKTPLCIFLAQEMIERGRRPVIVSRGYKGKIKGPHLVTNADTVPDVGDEPLLIAGLGICPVVICRDRLKAAEFIRRMSIGDMIILDDGFQHRRMKRQVDIVSINVSGAEAVNAFLRGEMLPLGFFRENRDRALARADIAVFSERGPESPMGEAEERLRNILPEGMPCFRSHLEVIGARAIDNSGELDGGRVVAFCGIANPEGFFRTVRSAGFEVAHEASFPDHYAFTFQDIEKLRRLFPGVPLLCTEKDAIKLRNFSNEPIYALKVRTRVRAGDAFLQKINDLISQRLPS
jgi:tetraacyldisaccharide 4'-kinase